MKKNGQEVLLWSEMANIGYGGEKHMSERIHPYQEFESTVLWKIVDKCIADLEKNQDVNITTRREYVVGYICKSLSDGGVGLSEAFSE